MLKFMDFCAGIGGGRLGLEACGFSCVAHSEIDEPTSKVYTAIHNDNNNFGDLMKIEPKELPNFDIMIAGFPCQTFSIVGKRGGFNDNRGLIINGLIKILKAKEVPFFILENVKGLVNHNNGETFKIILDLLDDAGYDVFPSVLDSINFGVAQMRERIYLIGALKTLNIHFDFKNLETKAKTPLKNFIGHSTDILKNTQTLKKYLENKYNKNKHNLENILEKDYLILDTRQSDLRLYENKVPTLRTGRHGILYTKESKLYKLSPLEAFLLQGFSKEHYERALAQEYSATKLLSMAGNAMTVNVIKSIGGELSYAISKK